MCTLIYDKMIDGIEALRRADRFGNTALHMAVIHRQGRVIKWILTQEADLRREEAEKSANEGDTSANTGKDDRGSAGEGRGTAAGEGREAGSGGRGRANGDRSVGTLGRRRSVKPGRGGLLDAMNGDGFTPLTLAARMGCVVIPLAVSSFSFSLT